MSPGRSLGGRDPWRAAVEHRAGGEVPRHQPCVEVADPVGAEAEVEAVADAAVDEDAHRGPLLDTIRTELSVIWMDCTTSIRVTDSFGVGRMLNSASRVVTPQPFVAVRRYWPVTGASPVTGGSVIESANLSGLVSGSAGLPMPMGVIWTDVAFETLHESTG